jgi:hypothetical protein
MNVFGSADVELRRVRRASMLEAAYTEVSRLLTAFPDLTAAELLQRLRQEADEASRQVAPVVTTN